MALRVGYEKLTARPGWQPQVSWEDGVAADDPLVRREPGPLDRPRRLAPDRRADADGRERVLVTGGGGFLGSHLVERLEADGHDVVAARRARLRPDRRWTTTGAAVRRRASPSSSSTSPPRSAGIGANRANPGRYWYANLVMGAHVLEQAACTSVAQARHRRHRLRLPEAHAGPVQRGRPLERLPGGDERPLRRREEGAPRRRAGLPRAVRAERDLPAAREPLRPARQLRPRELARDPGADPEDGRVDATRSCSGATARRRREFLYVDDCVEGLVLAAERYDGAEPVNLGTGAEISIRELAELIADADRLRGRDRLGHVDAERPAAAHARRLARGRALRLPGRARRSATGSSDRRLVPRSRDRVHAGD